LKHEGTKSTKTHDASATCSPHEPRAPFSQGRQGSESRVEAEYPSCVSVAFVASCCNLVRPDRAPRLAPNGATGGRSGRC